MSRPPLPLPGLLLVAASIVAHVWPDLVSVHTVERIAVVALVVILFNGGLDIGWRAMRRSAGPVVSLGVLGTFATAALVAAGAHVLLGLSWTLAGVMGAALAPTDPAVVFSVLSGTQIHSRAGTVLEGEAGLNDPAGIALMLGMIELATHPDASFSVVIVTFVVQMGLGLAFGFAAAWALLRAGGAALAPVPLLAFAGALYAVTALLGGSGFLAVFVAGLVLADTVAPLRLGSRLASVAEVVVFVALGLTVDLFALGGAAWRDGLVIMALLALAIRPLVVLGALAGARLERGDRIFVAWSGLKGAVPILLAAFAILEPVPGAQEVYDAVFVAVLASVLAQGSLVPVVARRVLAGPS